MSKPKSSIASPVETEDSPLKPPETPTYSDHAATRYDSPVVDNEALVSNASEYTSHTFERDESRQYNDIPLSARDSVSSFERRLPARLPGAPKDLPTRLVKWKERSVDRSQQLKSMMEESKAAECTFRPEVNPRSKAMTTGSSGNRFFSVLVFILLCIY